MNDLLKHLTFAKVEFTIEATLPLWLPAYKGSTFRGAFGSQFKRIVCINPKVRCESCILSDSCAYHSVFETPNLLQMDWFSSPRLPHPFVLEPPQTDKEYFAAGEQLTFRLVLIGGGIDYLPYFIFVFDRIGCKSGIGKNRKGNFGHFKICRVTDEFAGKKSIYDSKEKILHNHLTVNTAPALRTETAENGKDAVTLTFITPARLKHNGKFILLQDRNRFSAAVFLENLYRRAVLLTAGHCTHQSPENRFPDFTDVTVRDVHLHWYDWQRYSNRQQKKQQYGGFIGQVTLQGDMVKYLPLLKIGEIVHAGSGTAFGLGKYALSNG